MDVVWFAEIKWDYLRTRKQQIIRRRPHDVRLLYLEPYVRGRDNRFDLRTVDGIHCATIPFVKAVPGGAVRAALDRAWARALVDRAALGRVRRHLRAVGFAVDATAAVLSNVYAVGVARRLGAPLLVYDCNDAHADFPGMPAWTRGYVETAALRADEVFASSQALFDDVAGVRGTEAGVTLLGNGVDYERFAGERRRRGPRPSAETPCVGYLGAIAPWMDFAVVEALARARPDWRVVLVGPVLGGAGESVHALSALPNVEVRDAVAYERVPEVLSEFSVAMIPFRSDALTRGVNPNKMYEYLAMGVPVVTTRFSFEVEQYPGLVIAARDADEFMRGCDAFVEMASDADRRAMFETDADGVAAAHDWAAIAERFWNRVRELCARTT